MTERNKMIVRRFNKECLEQANNQSMKEMLSEDVINHTAASGSPNGIESFYYFINEVLHKGFSDLRVEIFEQIAERDLVTTRKTIHGKHTGEIFGIAPSGKSISINVIDIIRIKDNQYVEHWGASNFSDVLKELSTEK